MADERQIDRKHYRDCARSDWRSYVTEIVVNLQSFGFLLMTAPILCYVVSWAAAVLPGHYDLDWRILTAITVTVCTAELCWSHRNRRFRIARAYRDEEAFLRGWAADYAGVVKIRRAYLKLFPLGPLTRLVVSRSERRRRSRRFYRFFGCVIRWQQWRLPRYASSVIYVDEERARLRALLLAKRQAVSAAGTTGEREPS